ncbi:hypothetical protein ACQKE5_12160 [Paenisporosarcina sp. NPDC076898]
MAVEQSEQPHLKVKNIQMAPPDVALVGVSVKDVLPFGSVLKAQSDF